MKGKRVAHRNIDEYIATYPAKVKERLQRIRKAIRRAAPGATEAISYGIPAFNLKGYVVYFAGLKNHIGLYPAPRGNAAFAKELAAYEGGKGTVQFPHDRPIPYGLIGRIVRFRVKENLARAAAKGRKKR
jgi:uncharacterized protein YdhG (YjbR/CyaY superfamily)